MSELDEGIDAILDDPDLAKSSAKNYVNFSFGKASDPGFVFSGDLSIFNKES